MRVQVWLLSIRVYRSMKCWNTTGWTPPGRDPFCGFCWASCLLVKQRIKQSLHLLLPDLDYCALFWCWGKKVSECEFKAVANPSLSHAGELLWLLGRGWMELSCIKVLYNHIPGCHRHSSTRVSGGSSGLKSFSAALPGSASCVAVVEVCMCGGELISLLLFCVLPSLYFNWIISLI